MKNTIIWAIDPYEKDVVPEASLIAQITSWSESTGSPLQPVYLLSKAPEQPGAKSFDPNLLAEQKKADEYLKKMGVRGAASTKLISLPAASRADEIKALLEYAEGTHPSCILISSHGRSGLGRLFFGSFAEALLLQSTLPIFFLDHAEPRSQKLAFQKVLFATDFSERSKLIFMKFLRHVKAQSLKLVLFHAVSLPATALLASQDTQVVISPDYFTEQEEWAKEEGSNWERIAESFGIKVDLAISSNGIGADIASLLLQEAKAKEIDFIAMSSASSTISALALGSLSQDVFRSNLFPVWVYGPKVLL